MKDKINTILHKGKSRTANESDKQQMYALFHQAESEYELKNNLLEELNNVQVPDTNSPDFKQIFKELWEKIEKDNKQTKAKTRFLGSLIKVAAAVVIGLFLGLYITELKGNQEPVYYTAYSPRGSVSEMVLPDGSIIFLNSDSEIKYTIDGKKGVREVFLNGEAWFEVEKNKKKPFVVHTPFYDVNVTGTQFNVKAYELDDVVTTTLEQGQVVIQSTENFRLAEEVCLKPGEQIVLDKSSRELTIQNVNTHWFTSWKDNKLIFVNMDLKQLIVLLERKYGVDIEVKNKTILDLHFDGTLKNETIFEILEIIKKTLPINYKIIGQKIEITAKN
jgi:ferric-dicitrate binding protein FerR (iron transport regulator)